MTLRTHILSSVFQVTTSVFETEVPALMCFRKYLFLDFLWLFNHSCKPKLPRYSALGSVLIWCCWFILLSDHEKYHSLENPMGWLEAGASSKEPVPLLPSGA